MNHMTDLSALGNLDEIEQDVPTSFSDKSHSVFTSDSSNDKFEALLPSTVPLVLDDLLKTFDFSFIIGQGDKAKGDIEIGKGKALLIRGQFDGNITCPGQVFVLKEGKVNGNIKAGQLWIDGEIGVPGEGSKIEAGSVHVGNTARINADIEYELLSMANHNRGITGRLSSRNHGNQN